MSNVTKSSKSNRLYGLLHTIIHIFLIVTAISDQLF